MSLLTDPVRRVLILCVTSLAVVTLSSGLVAEYLYPTDFRIGEVATRTVRAPRDLFVEDLISTERQRAEAERSVRRMFEMDEPAPKSVSAQVRGLFDAIDSYSSNPGSLSGSADLEPEERAQIEKTFRLTLGAEEWAALLDRSQWIPLEATVSKLVYPILRRGILADKARLHSILDRSGVNLIRLPSGSEQPLFSDSMVYDTDEALQVFESLIPQNGFGRGALFDTIVRKLGTVLLKPNIRYNRQLTEERLKLARETVEPVYYQIRRGETIVRIGDRVNAIQEGKLARIRELRGTSSVIRGLVGYFVLCGAVLFILYTFFVRHWQGFRPGVPELWVLSLTLIGSIVLERLGVLIGGALNFNFPDIDSEALAIVAPLAAGGVLLQAILGPAYVLFFTLSFVLLTGIGVEESWLKLVLICAGNVVGTFTAARSARRSAFLSVSLRIAIVNVVLVLCHAIIFPQQGAGTGAAAILCCVIGGLLSGVLAAGLLPVAEFIGGYVTPMKLLELASLDRALLRELSLHAPGTWNHSIMMGQLAEAAAESVGANPLLARVGAYYHDIGKTRKPLYFVENQVGKENRHDKLTPSMSALIIRSHVKDGLEMAKAVRLPQALMDFIAQHHGTALIEFFYEKAQKEAESGETIDENLFRYPGPKPQTKESGILMLADQVEAVSRTLVDPSPAKIQGMVQKIINRVFASGQLDESELTLKDLHFIARGFTRVLTGISHRRVEYPEPAAERSSTDRTNAERHATDRPHPEKTPHAEKAHKSESAPKPEASQRSEGGNSSEGAAEKREGASAGAHPPHEKNGHKKAESDTEKDGSHEDKNSLKRLGI